MATFTSKQCCYCKETKDISEFPPRPDRGPTAVQSDCRVCRRERQKARYEASKGDVRAASLRKEAQRRYREKNRDRILANERSRREADPERTQRHRREARLRKYGLTQERYDALLEAQGFQCPCGEPFAGRTPDIDHDHACCPGDSSCGLCVRGLLCGLCNRMAGYMERAVPGSDDPAVRARRILDYLDAWYGRTQ